MNKKVHGWKGAMLAVLLLAWFCCINVLAEGASGDNSLSSLGILTEGVTVSPEFYYSTIEYNVTVPAGTSELSLDPVTSNSSAAILDISGTTLTDGAGTVVITVQAENGSQCGYYLYVTPDESAVVQTEAQTEKETEPVTEAETESETEDPRYVKVDRNSLQEAANTIDALKSETVNYRDRLNLLMKILYGMIALCVVLLFVVINLILKKKDLKAELREYQSYGYGAGTEGSYQNGYDQQYDGQSGYQNGYDPQYDSQDGYQGDYDPQYDSHEDYQGGYDQQYDDQTGYDAQGDQDGWESSQEGQVTFRTENVRQTESRGRGKKAEKKQEDDPATVPKPAKSKKKVKKMPEYQQPKAAPEYQPQEKNKKDVEITMIDL